MTAAALMARGMLLLLAWSSPPRHLVAGLRVPPTGDPDAKGAKELQREQQLPTVSEFTRVWTMRYESEHRLQEPMPAAVQLVLGIMAQPWQTDYRAVVRRTWLNQTGVCLWSGGPPRKDCSVHVAFVYGSRGQGSIPAGLHPDVSDEESARSEPGSFVLDIEENMNEGKTFAWFKAAAEAFPWATHIGKCDMDTYPFLHKLVKRMGDRACAGRPHMRYEYAGRGYRCHAGIPYCHGYDSDDFSSSCTQHRCEKAYDSTEERKFSVSRPGDPFSYMGGQLYMMSRELAQELVRPGGWWESHSSGGWLYSHEDMTTSMAIDITAAERGFCVSTWKPDAHYHKGEQVSTDYANNF